MMMKTLRQQDGFTLVELMITMVAFVLVIIGASNIFTGLLAQFKQQSKMAETNIEGAIGLDIMRRDLESSGMGLPLSGLIAYAEPAPNYYGLNNAPAGAPRAIVSANNVAGGTGPAGMIAGSDYLVIRATNMMRYDNNVSEKWTTLRFDNTLVPPEAKRDWGASSGENLDPTDRVIVISPASNNALVTAGGSFHTAFNNTAAFAPTDPTVTRLIYGIAPASIPNPLMPFNRADYYVRRPPVPDPVVPPQTMPQRCAQNTGILYKATVNQSTGAYEELPVLDCVADMQIIYRRDVNSDGVLDCAVAGECTDDISTVSALNIVDQVKEVRVYILAHEGQFDRNYLFTNFTAGLCPTCIRVGESLYAALGNSYDLATILNYQNYRWKVYTLVVKPNNLR